MSGNIKIGIAPACRALIAPVEMATGKQAYFCGKPNPLMMRTDLRLLGCHSEEAVIIGESQYSYLVPFHSRDDQLRIAYELFSFDFRYYSIFRM